MPMKPASPYRKNYLLGRTGCFEPVSYGQWSFLDRLTCLPEKRRERRGRESCEIAERSSIAIAGEGPVNRRRRKGDASHRIESAYVLVLSSCSSQSRLPPVLTPDYQGSIHHPSLSIYVCL